MRPLTIEDAHVIEIAIQQEIIRSGEARYDHRLHGLLLVCKGYSCNKTADILGQSPRTVVSWVRRFEEHGLAGLQDHERPGRPSSLETDQA
jgi:transposase